MKVSLYIEVPAISQAYEILVPDFLKVKEALRLISKAIEQLSDQQYMVSGTEVLVCPIDSDYFLLDPDTQIKDYHLDHGDHMLMF